ncbi:hypothetical protein GCM10017608_25220 [Agromyces luteolus]|nr:hypothetical protein GCM10017608_25220 [Agromyces luteolus]
MGAAGSHAVVASIASENTASTPNTLAGARPIIGTTARITVRGDDSRCARCGIRSNEWCSFIIHVDPPVGKG